MDLKRLFQPRWLLLVSLLLLAGCAFPAQALVPISPQAARGTTVPAEGGLPSKTPSAPLTATPIGTTQSTTAPSPTPPSTSTAVSCSETSGRVEEYELSTTHQPRPLQVRVYLPPCFNPAVEFPYPVLLMLHGQTYTNDQWERLGITRAADQLIESGAVPPMLIVLPTEQDTLSNPFESGYDLALVDDLLPWLEKNFPACRERECRAIGGLSRGAAWAFYIGLTHWQTFGVIGAHSDAPFYGDFNRLPYLAREIPKDQLPQIWMDSGKADMYLSEARHYHELLLENKVPHAFTLFDGEHNETYWSQHAADYLRWYGSAFTRK